MSVYFIRNSRTESIKVGYSVDPYERLATLQTGNEDTLTMEAVMPGGMEVEKRLHHRWEAHSIRGEWFEPDQEILDYIRAVNVVSRIYREMGAPGLGTLFGFLIGRYNTPIGIGNGSTSQTTRQEPIGQWTTTWLRTFGSVEPQIFPLPPRKHLNQVLRRFMIESARTQEG